MAYKNENGEVIVYAVVNKKTGVISEGDDIIEQIEHKYPLIEGYEWAAYKLTPYDMNEIFNGNSMYTLIVEEN